MSRRNARIKTISALEPYPDDGEIFQVFDQHRRKEDQILRGSIQRKNSQLEKKLLKRQVAPVSNPAEEDHDPARVSRLFYLQLYSSVLNSESASASEKVSKSQKLLASLPKVTKSLSDITNTLLRKSSTKPGQLHSQLQQTLSEDFERDAGDSIHETVVVETRLSQDSSIDDDASLSVDSSNAENNDTTSRNMPPPTNLRMNENPSPVPVLNTRMKNLSQFSFRYRENERESRVRVVETTSRSCHAKKTLCSSLFVTLVTLATILVLTLVLSSPQAFLTHFDVVYLPDARPESRPSIAFCLPMPFEAGKMKNLGVTSELASFLLYTLSPFYPNPDILDKPKLLTDLTGQYRSFAAKLRRRIRSGSTSSPASLKGLLNTVAPSCSELVKGCQTGNGAILRGEECCRILFDDKIEYGPDGLCLVGGGKELALISYEPKFPIAPRPFSLAKLTVVLNMASRMPVDHRVVPWDPVNNDIITASVIKDGERPAFRDIRQDFVVRPGHLVSVTAEKRQTLRSRVFQGSFCKSTEQDRGASTYNYAACQSSVVQLIAEKSVNCSLISLPKEDKSLPFCGPLEGLALMYILREQEALVTINSTMLHRFESTLTHHCPFECESQTYETEVTADAIIDDKTAALFGAKNPSDIAIIEMRYRADPLVKSLRHVSVLLVIVERLGSISGCVLTLAFIYSSAAKLLRKRRQMMFKR